MGMGLVGKGVIAGLGQGLEKGSEGYFKGKTAAAEIGVRSRHYKKMEEIAAQRNRFLQGLYHIKDPSLAQEYNQYLEGETPPTPSALPQQGQPMPTEESPSNTLAQGVSAMDLGQAYG